METTTITANLTTARNGKQSHRTITAWQARVDTANNFYICRHAHKTEAAALACGAEIASRVQA